MIRRGMLFLSKIPDWAWLATAFLLRAGFVLTIGERLLQTDELGYTGAAAQWAATGIIGAGGKAVALPLLPALFFGAFFKFSSRLLWPRLGQAVVGTLAAWLIGRMARTLSGSEAAGRAALAVACVYPFFIYYCGILQSETLDVTMIAAGLWALGASLADGGKDAPRAAAAGLFLGVSALVRAESFPIFGVIWPALLVLTATGRWRLRAWSLAAVFWLAPILCMCARNQRATGHFTLDDHGGMAMVHGTILFNLNEQDTGIAMSEFKQTSIYREGQSLDDHERDRFYLRESLEFMSSHPAQTVRQWGAKCVNFWRFYPRLDKRYAETSFSHPGAGFSRLALVVISLLFEPWLIVGGLCGLWDMRHRWPYLLPGVLFLAGTMAVHVLSVSQMRYRLPIMPILMVGAASLLARLAGGKSADCRFRSRPRD